MGKMLIAIDGSKNALKAVDYAGHQFSGIGDLEITLLHVMPYVPTSFWDDGHILTVNEREERKKVVDKWLSNQRQMTEPMFNEAARILTGRGIKDAQIRTKTVSDSADVAESIIEEARDGGYQTLVIGRCGLSPAKHFLMGSVAAKIINHGVGITVCVVE